MQITEFKKYISWNIISLIGFGCAVISAVFWFMLNIASSGLDIREDIDIYFSEYIVNFLIKPYFELFIYQLFFIVLLIIGAKFENKHYIENNKEGLNLFVDNEKIYSRFFITGIMLNFLPLLILLVIAIGYYIKHL